jgi:hypothetical protein
VCSYDRANQGQSGSAPTPRTADDLIQDLHGLVAGGRVRIFAATVAVVPIQAGLR